MDPVGHILEIFEIFGLGIGIGHSGRLYGSGPDVENGSGSTPLWSELFRIPEATLVEGSTC